MYDINRIKEPRYKRLANEHLALEELCSRSEKISYKIHRQLGTKPPDAYLIQYSNLKSIIGIKEDTQMPIYGEEHTVRIEFPKNYPAKGPICYMESSLWHPNIRWSGEFKGRICINNKALGAGYSLDVVVVRIGEILQYKNYLAENVNPFPEDEQVAKWVREFAEPKGIVNKRKNIVVDEEELLDPLNSDFDPRELPKPPKPKLKISLRGSSLNKTEKDKGIVTKKPLHPQISISKRQP